MGIRAKLDGLKFGNLIVLNFSHIQGKQQNCMWNCLCDCGNYTKVSTANLKNSGIQSCGCFPNRKIKDLVGQKFNLLTVVSFSHRCINNKPFWKCICDCGDITIVRANNLVSGGTKSCGCLSKLHSLKTKHGLTVNNKKNNEIKSWAAMKQRCYNKKSPSYKHYGGRGITVCNRWLNSVENFILDMGIRPSIKHTLDRFPDVNGNYEPLNCRWATLKQQGETKRTNVLYYYNGKMINQSDLAKELKTFSSNINLMLKRKSIDDVINYYLNKNKNGSFVISK